VHLTHLFNHCLQLGHFPASWKEAKIIILLKPGKDPKFTFHQPLVHYGQIIGDADFKNNPKYPEERLSLNASQFGFRADHSTTLQCMRLEDHVTLNFDNNMSTAAVFLDIEKAFETTWHSVLL
jgi:hypothetical protein